jgi:hypothetical protein
LTDRSALDLPSSATAISLLPSHLTSAAPSFKPPPALPASGNMASTSGHSDCEPHRISAREEHYKKARPSSPHLHRRVNSAELECMGCQFQTSSKQMSLERAKELDIPKESISYRRTMSIEPLVEIVRVARHQPSLLGSSRGGPRSTSTPAPIIISYPMSQEQFHLFIQQRSVVKQEDTSGMSRLFLSQIKGCS